MYVCIYINEIEGHSISSYLYICIYYVAAVGIRLIHDSGFDSDSYCIGSVRESQIPRSPVSATHCVIVVKEMIFASK